MQAWIEWWRSLWRRPSPPPDPALQELQQDKQEIRAALEIVKVRLDALEQSMYQRDDQSRQY